MTLALVQGPLSRSSLSSFTLVINPRPSLLPQAPSLIPLFASPRPLFSSFYPLSLLVFPPCSPLSTRNFSPKNDSLMVKRCADFKNKNYFVVYQSIPSLTTRSHCHGDRVFSQLYLLGARGFESEKCSTVLKEIYRNFSI